MNGGWLTLPMNNASLLVQILKRIRHLHDHVSAQVFAKVRQANDLVEELASRAQLEDEEVVLLGLGELDQADNVGVIQLSHDLNFFEDIGPL